MRKVSAILQSKTCDCTVACAPCYAPEGCADNEFYAEATQSGSITNYLGGSNESASFTRSVTSCVSYNDALNKATWSAMLAWLTTTLLPDWDAWEPTRSNEEISATAYCPCGWTGDPVTVTIPAGTYEGYWTIAEANWVAYTAALAEANELLDCTPPA